MSDLVEREIVREKMLKYGFTAPDMTVHEFIEDELPSVTQKYGKWIEGRKTSGYLLLPLWTTIEVVWKHRKVR